MPYSESQSHSSFRPVDYNDLDLTFSQETSYSHYHARQNGDNFKLSLQSIDDNELDDFRRSLITPMSNNNIRDPMYVEFERANAQPKHVSNKRHQTLSPTNSYTDSVTDSLAVFNRLLDDQKSTDDFLEGDLNDFMSPYNMDDLVSLPSSSPQTNHHTNITSAYQTKNNVSPNHNNNSITYNSYNKPRKASIDASVQTMKASPTRTSSKERLETKYGNKTNKPEHPIRKLQPKQQEDKRRWSSYLPDKKSTIKLSQLSSRNKLSTTTATTNNKKVAEQQSTSATQQLQNKGRALPLSDVKSPLEKRNSTHSLQRSSSLISKPLKDPATPTTTISSRFKNPINDSSAVPTPRFLQRSNPNRMSWNDSSSYQKESAQQQEEKSEMYLQRRLSLMTDNNEQSIIPNMTSLKATAITKTERPHKDVTQPQTTTTTTKTTTATSRYAQKRLSVTDNNDRTITPIKTSSKDIPITKTERPNKDVSQPQPTTTTSRYAQKRLSIRTKPVENNTTPAIKEEQKNTSIFHTRRHLPKQEKDTLVCNDNTNTNHEQSSVKKSYGSRKQVSTSAIPVPNTTTSTVPVAVPTSTTSSLLRRARSLTAPSNKYINNSDQTQKPSLMPVPTFRHRKHSGTNLSKYASVPEEEVASPSSQPMSPPVSPPVVKGVRYSLSKQPVASQSSSGQSNTTTCSSHSEDLDYNPLTPPSSYIDPSSFYERRRSFTKDAPNITRLNKYGTYLAKMKDTYEIDIKPKNYSRQRVLSEDNNQYKEQKRRSVTESAREVLAQVQERRAKTAAILNSIHYD